MAHIGKVVKSFSGHRSNNDNIKTRNFTLVIIICNRIVDLGNTSCVIMKTTLGWYTDNGEMVWYGERENNQKSWMWWGHHHSSEVDISSEGKDSGSGNTSRQNNNQKIKVCSVDNFFFLFIIYCIFI